MRSIVIAAGLVIPLGTTLLQAELPSPRLDVLNPVGLSAGTSVEVTLTGPDLEGCETLHFDHPGLSAEFIKERTFKIMSAGDVPHGTYDVTAIGRFGVTNPRVLQITHGLNDVAEVEPNNTLAMPQTVNLNSAINGTGDGNNRDVYRLSLKAGQRISIDCHSARLETEMDPLLILFTAEGQQVASNSDYYGRDAFLDFIAPVDGDYCIEVRDLTYRGGHPYRLLIHDRPHVENVFPRAVTAGQTVELTAFGSNLGDGAEPSDLAIEGVPLFRKTFSYTTPNDILSLGLFRERIHTLQHSVIPTAATCTITGEQILPFDADPCVLLLTDQTTSLEAEPNDTKEQPQPLALPAMVSGRFDEPRDADWYVFETDETGGNYGFDVYAERIDGRCDPYFALYDDQGNRFFENDDFGHRISAFDGHLRDPSVQTSLPAKKQIRLLVQDRYQRGGPRYQYVLSVRKARSDFYAESIHSNTNAAGTNLWKGGAAYLDIVLHHQDGGNQFPVAITAEGLPAGVHASPTVITNNTRGTFVLWSAADAADFTGPITLLATSKHAERELKHLVRPYTRAYQQTGSRTMRQQMICVREPAPYALQLEPERITVEAGKPLELKLRATRAWSNFTGNIDYQPLNFPGQFQLGNGTIASGSNEVTLSINVQPGTQPGDYTLTVLGQAQVPFNKDPAATDKPKTLVSMPSRPVTITVTAPEK
ncbi:hypothetical protein GC163_11995 [bacterium]|nr:hypothetical protein [bacterium]